MVDVAYIQQGAVGQLVKGYSIGVVSIACVNDEHVAVIAVWPTDRPQEKRNDFISKHRVIAGDFIPVGGKIYQIVGVIDEKNKSSLPEYVKVKEIGHGLLLIDSRPKAQEGVELQSDSLVISLGNTAELHGIEIQFSELKPKFTNGTETSAAFLELWPNDYEKAAAKEQGLVRSIEVLAGEDIEIGTKTHKILSIIPHGKNLFGWIEIDTN